MKRKIGEMIKEQFIKKGVKIILIIIVILGFIGFISYNNRADVDTEYINSVLEKSSELTSAKVNYTGMSEYHDTGIPIINKSDFIMVYKATARAGINVKDISVKKNKIKKEIIITIPKAKVLDVKIKPNSIKYFDSKFALLNTDEKEDSVKAMKLAEKAALKEVENMGILSMADEQSATLVKGLLKDCIPDNYKIVIHKK